MQNARGSVKCKRHLLSDRAKCILSCMKHHRDIIRDTGAEAIRSMLGLESINTVRAWARRNSIPAEHWVALARAKVATLEQLAEAAAMRAA